MRTHNRWPAALLMVVGLACLSGCLLRADGGGGAGAMSSSDGSSEYSAIATIPAGTPLAVRFASRLSSETARVGDRWSGAVVNSVSIGPRDVIPAGSPVRGVVTAVHGTEPGARAILDLVVQDVRVAGRIQSLSAITMPVVAGSLRARNLGATAGEAAILKTGTVMMFTVSEQVTMKQG
jgi:hypothetical protein